MSPFLLPGDLYRIVRQLRVQIQPPVHRDALMVIGHAPVMTNQCFDLGVDATFEAVGGSFYRLFDTFWWINEGEQVSLVDEFFQQFVGTAVPVVGVPPGRVVAGEFWCLICRDVMRARCSYVASS